MASGEAEPRSRTGSDYAELKRLVGERGLLTPRPRYYAATTAATLSAIIAGFAFLLRVRRTWLAFLAAPYLALAFIQAAFIAHDLGHRQLLRRSRWLDAAGLLLGNLLLGIGRSWWIDKHNAHHSHPNQIDADPDIDIAFVAFSEAEARAKQGLARLITSYQAYLMFPLMFVAGVWSWHLYSAQTALERKARGAHAELALLAGHAVWYVGLVVGALGLGRGLLFIVLHKGLMGLYAGSAFAANHKGMPVLGPDESLDFVRHQVLTSRNITPSWFTDFWYGGLNYQIEHHLFPTMPRPSLRPARDVVRAFCARRGITYHETGMLQALKEVLRHMHVVSAPLRARGARSYGPVAMRFAIASGEPMATSKGAAPPGTEERPSMGTSPRRLPPEEGIGHRAPDPRVGDPPVTRLLLVVMALGALVALYLGVKLFFFTEAARRDWMWPMLPFGIRFLGAVYLAALVPTTAVVLVRRWSPARLVVPVVMAFSGVLLLMSLVYLDRFQWGSWSPWLWFGLYVVLPLTSAYHLRLYWLHRRLPPAPAATLPGAWRLALQAEGAALALYGLALAAVPSLAAAGWPWAVDAFHARLYSAPFFAIAVGAWLLARRAPPAELLTLGLTQTVLGFFPVLAVVSVDAALRRVNWSLPGPWVWVGAFALLGALGLGLLWEWWTARRTLLRWETSYAPST